MNQDMCIPCGEGLINIRVGAIIMQDGNILMVGNRKRPEYLYSVGGRIQFGETAEEAVIREVYEETGVRMAIDRLGFVHENYFYGDDALNDGKLIYELALYFYMKTPGDFAPVCSSFTEDGQEEFLRWITPGDAVKIFPQFFHTELQHPTDSVKFFSVDER